eukprot:CAMPEP_0197037758 /NCGR_PEP_ID=MMETSP1384-20130603/14884_1 /TAXON_ID=29189 /ORGANISM="Ammonia sp." /LENGTH=227 /DNA_ID=CAMNT_0042468105 /DNA_START=86 /DNA_END=769 /DNA_ORIENTATION=-
MDHKTKHVVYGYIRKYARDLITSHGYNPFYNVPELISMICLLYFYSSEHFGIHHDGSILSTNSKVVKNTKDNEWISVFGRQTIDSLSDLHFQWRIKLALNSCWYIIGLTSNPDNTELPFQRNTVDVNYAYYAQCNEAFFKYKRKEYGEFSKRKEFKDCSELTVLMDLDLKQHTLSFYLINNQSLFKMKKFQGIMYGDVKKEKGLKYHLALSLHGQNAQASIEDFRVV